MLRFSAFENPNSASTNFARSGSKAWRHLWANRQPETVPVKFFETYVGMSLVTIPGNNQHENPLNSKASEA